MRTAESLSFEEIGKLISINILECIALTSHSISTKETRRHCKSLSTTDASVFGSLQITTLQLCDKFKESLPTEPESFELDLSAFLQVFLFMS